MSAIDHKCHIPTVSYIGAHILFGKNTSQKQKLKQHKQNSMKKQTIKRMCLQNSIKNNAVWFKLIDRTFKPYVSITCVQNMILPDFC